MDVDLSVFCAEFSRLESWRCLACVKRQLHFTVFSKPRSLHVLRYASLIDPDRLDRPVLRLKCQTCHQHAWHVCVPPSWLVATLWLVPILLKPLVDVRGSSPPLRRGSSSYSLYRPRRDERLSTPWPV